MKANAKDLFEAIRAVVRDEVKKSLPGMVREHLSETYIRKMVAESSVQKKKNGKSIAELLTVTDSEDKNEKIPEPLENSDKGIYNDDMTQKYEESISKLKKDLGPMSFVFENVKIPDESAVVETIPADAMDKVGFDFSRMNEVLNRASSNNEQMKQNDDAKLDAKMKEIERRRKLLEVPVK